MYLVMIKVFTDIGGIELLHHFCLPIGKIIYSLNKLVDYLHVQAWYNYCYNASYFVLAQLQVGGQLYSPKAYTDDIGLVTGSKQNHLIKGINAFKMLFGEVYPRIYGRKFCFTATRKRSRKT